MFPPILIFISFCLHNQKFGICGGLKSPILVAGFDCVLLEVPEVPEVDESTVVFCEPEVVVSAGIEGGVSITPEASATGGEGGISSPATEGGEGGIMDFSTTFA